MPIGRRPRRKGILTTEITESTEGRKQKAEAASAAWREAICLRMVNRGIFASGASRWRTKEEKKAKAQSKRT
jgi:hypothetical protein